MNTEHIIKHVEYLVSQDETELALKCLDMVPAYFRDHRILELEKLRSEILSKVLMPVELSDDWRELPKTKEHCISFLQSTARGMVLKESLEKANNESVFPLIVEFGPGDFCFPLALKHLGFKFFYRAVGFHKEAINQAKDLLGSSYVDQDIVAAESWLVAYEIIEHLADTSEIRQVADRMKTPPNKIFLSTPKYTYGNGTDWRNDGIHHRRAYTPNEFINESRSLFPQIKKWEFTDNSVMVLKGEVN